MNVGFSEKVSFIKTFALFSDQYSGKNSYSKIILLLTKFLNHEYNKETPDIVTYALIKVFDYDGITYLQERDYNSFEYNKKHSLDSNYFERMKVIIELNKLLTNIQLKHPLINVFYHLTSLKIINNISQNNIQINLNTSDFLDANLFVFQTSILPFTKLDIYSPENVLTVNDFKDFYSKYPLQLNALTFSNSFTVENASKYMKSKIDTVLENMDSFFDTLILSSCHYEYMYDDDYDADIDQHDLIYNPPKIKNISQKSNKYVDILSSIRDFDLDFFNINFKPLKADDFKGCFKVINTPCDYNYGYEGGQTTTLNSNVLVLDIVKFVNKLKGNI
jgi:hypothetical protein